MIFLHKRSKVLYRMLFVSFDVATQRKHIVYMNMETGAIFNRDAEKFHKSFDHHSNPQDDIEPNPDQVEFDFEGENHA